jgi:hypothetical protein
MKTIESFFDDWCEEYGYEVNLFALECYTLSGDRERDFQRFMQGKSQEEALLLLEDKP